MPTDTYAALTPYLHPGERLLWAGRPKQGLLLRGEDAWLIPFTLVWSLFAFSFLSATPLSTPFPFNLILPLFSIVGFYFLIGRFLVDMWLRSRTYYGLTDQRAVIVTGGFTRNLRSVNLRALADLKLTERRDRTGTIELGRPEARYFGRRGSRAIPFTI